MPPVAIMVRVFAFFIFVALIITIVYYTIYYWFKPKADVVIAKVDAEHKVDEVHSKKKQKEIYDEALKRMKK